MDSKKGRKQSEEDSSSGEKEHEFRGKGKLSERMFSPLDKELLRQCNINSLIYACIPFMTLYSVGYRAFMIRSKRQPSFLGYMFFSAFGYFMGRLAYFPFCQKKIAESPSMSLFAQLTREMIGYEVKEKAQRKKKKPYFDEELKDKSLKENNDKVDVEITYDELRKQNRSKAPKDSSE